MLQHIATRWPNARNMLYPTLLRYVALTCCVHLAEALRRLERVFLLQVRARSTHAITNMHASAGEHSNDAYLDRSCSKLMQKRIVKLPPTDFGCFSCNPYNGRTGKIYFFTVSIRLDGATVVSHTWELN